MPIDPAGPDRQDGTGGTGLRSPGGCHDGGRCDEAAPARHCGRDALPRGAEAGTADPDPGGDPEDLADILYTSGSTGAPKGVCLSHRNALAFVDWAVAEIDARQADRFANHAPFHFDLSVLDLYAAFRVGASVHLIPAEMSLAPTLLVDYLLQCKITVWYSVPSALILMARDGGMLDVSPSDFTCEFFSTRAKYSRLSISGCSVTIFPRVFSICTVRRRPTYAAFYEVMGIPADQVRSVPIGRACSGDRIWAERVDGTPTGPGEEGELVVDGPTVMLGYWGQPRRDGRPYRTGDRVTLLDSGDYQYLGRRDGMIKVRGHRVEVGRSRQCYTSIRVLPTSPSSSLALLWMRRSSPMSSRPATPRRISWNSSGIARLPCRVT